MLWAQDNDISDDIDAIEIAYVDENYSQASSSEPAGYKKVFVGLEVSGKEVDSLDIIQVSDQYLLPIAQIAPHIQAAYTLQKRHLIITVPSGQVSIPSAKTYVFDKQVWISLDELNKQLLLKGIFEQSKFSIQLFPPWNNKQVDKVQSSEGLEVDVRPESFSIRQIQFAHEVRTENSNVLSERSEFIASGAAVDGTWHLEAAKNDQQDWHLDDYFWIKRDANSQWLFGKQQVSPSVVSPSVTLTGAQYFYSNTAIPYDSYEDISQSGFFRQLGNSIQTIRGQAAPGSLLQLYVNGQLLKEQFARLDGSYDFGNVQMPSSLFNEIEVWVLDSVSRVLIEKQNKTRANSEHLLDQGQIVTSIALGKKGNLLDENYQDQGEAGMLLYRYGASDKITIEAGYLLDDLSVASVGIAAAVGENFVSASRFAYRNNAQAVQFELNGYGEKWRFNSYARHEEAGYFEQSSEDKNTANFNYYYLTQPNFRLELYGRYQTGTREISFIKPGFHYSPSSALSFGSRPDFEGDYRHELVYRPSRDKRLRLISRSQEDSGRFDWNINDNVTTYASARRYEHGDDTQEESVSEQALGFYWRPDDWDSYSFFRLEARHSDKYDTGAYAEFRTRIFSGVYFDLRVQTHDPEFDGKLSAFARVSFDFALAGGRFIPARNRTSYNTDGTIAGRLITDSGECDIDNISLLLNGLSYKVPVQGCNFYLQRVTPKIYQVGLDSEFLPIELIPQAETYVAEVAPAAVTRIDFVLRSEYSAAGKLLDINGQALANGRVLLLNSELQALMETRSDQFGNYRVDGLANGQYWVQLLDEEGNLLKQRSFKVDNDFLFGIDLSLQE